MSTLIDPKICGHNAGVRIDDWARPGTVDQDPFLIVRCESCNQIITVMREGHLLSRFGNLFQKLDDILIALEATQE